MSDFTLNDISRIEKELKDELKKVIIGQDEVIENLIIALLAGGHVLIEGIPGLGKTLLASSLAYVLSGDYKRVQFTPDLMPSDITGTTVYNSEKNIFTVKKGPVFTNLLLADEINRAPAKTQSSLLQAMQEKEVTIDGTSYPLEDFFICLATQNPIEMEGTYPLPEAQIDRFFMKLLINYPSLEDEREILKNYRRGFDAQNLKKSGLNAILKKDDLQKISQTLTEVQIEDTIINYITDLISATRNRQGIDVGASPRGSVDLFKASRVVAAVAGRDFVIPDDVKKVAFPILRHRILLDIESEIEGIKTDEYLQKIIDSVEVPR